MELTESAGGWNCWLRPRPASVSFQIPWEVQVGSRHTFISALALALVAVGSGEAVVEGVVHLLVIVRARVLRELRRVGGVIWGVVVVDLGRALAPLLPQLGIVDLLLLLLRFLLLLLCLVFVVLAGRIDRVNVLPILLLVGQPGFVATRLAGLLWGARRLLRRRLWLWRAEASLDG